MSPSRFPKLPVPARVCKSPKTCPLGRAGGGVRRGLLWHAVVTDLGGPHAVGGPAYVGKIRGGLASQPTALRYSTGSAEGSGRGWCKDNDLGVEMGIDVAGDRGASSICQDQSRPPYTLSSKSRPADSRHTVYPKNRLGGRAGVLFILASSCPCPRVPCYAQNTLNGSLRGARFPL